MAGDKSDWIQVVPWGIALVGLITTHLFSEARERRKEVRAQLDKLVERLSALEASAREFHIAAEYDEARARAIDVEIARVERIVGRLLLMAPSVSNAVIEHRQALTLQNFDAGSFVSQPANSVIVSEIQAATVEYEEALERVYRDRYPARFPYFRLVRIVDHNVALQLLSLGVGAMLGGVWVYLITR